MVLRLLAKLSPEQVADLSGMSLAEVEAILRCNPVFVDPGSAIRLGRRVDVP